jgi:2-polyprenyl-6-methoxyphenol hydroxylase-like FAD-dependent oxidoreductase
MIRELRGVADPGPNGHAVIIGGGIAGLLTAHAIACHFERVTILERFSHIAKSNSRAPPTRRGIPQSRCIHLLMASGAAAFDELVPGWQQELRASGSHPFDPCADATTRFPAGQLPRTPSGIAAYSCSRALFEKAIYGRLPGTVHLQADQKVAGLLYDPRGASVSGVRTVNRRAGDQTDFLADLVVDASGEGSGMSRWIACLPNRPRLQVKKSVVESGIRYVSRWFEMEPADAPDWHCCSIAPGIGSAFRSAMMLRAEENRWAVVLLAPAGETLPCDDTSFAQFIADLRDRELQRAFGRAKPVSAVLRYGPTSNRMKHFDLLAEWPKGLVALGDSVCTLNPYFGLGMTLAARGATLLRKCLDQQGKSLSTIDFQKRLAELNVEPWQLATGREFNGRNLAGTASLCRLYDSAPSSPEATHAILAVQHLLLPAETLREVAI